MAKYTIEDSTLAGIADAIREKTGGTEAVAVADMATQIAGITVSSEPTIEVSDSGLITVTSGELVATKQLSSADDADLIPRNIVSGRSIFGISGEAYRFDSTIIETASYVSSIQIDLPEQMQYLGMLILQRGEPAGWPLSTSNVVHEMILPLWMRPGENSSGTLHYFTYFTTTSGTVLKNGELEGGVQLNTAGTQLTISLPSGYYFDFPNSCGQLYVIGY